MRQVHLKNDLHQQRIDLGFWFLRFHDESSGERPTYGPRSFGICSFFLQCRQFVFVMHQRISKRDRSPEVFVIQDVHLLLDIRNRQKVGLCQESLVTDELLAPNVGQILILLLLAYRVGEFVLENSNGFLALVR